ncbi:sulfite exporter TauE/SafE family protein [Verrucomicrobiota bacterium]
MIAEIIRMNWYWFVLIGFAAGILSGSLGVGAGILIVPALVLGLGFEQKIAQGTCLAVMAPMALIAWWRYHLNPDIKLNPNVIFFIIPFALLGAVIGSGIAARLPAIVLRRAFGIFVILVGLRMLWGR